MVFIWKQASSAILTDFLQAREANICLTLEGLHMTPGQSLNMKISSSMSCGPKVQFLLVGNDINLTLWVTGAETFAIINKKNRALHKITSLREKLRNYFDILLWCGLHIYKCLNLVFWWMLLTNHGGNYGRYPFNFNKKKLLVNSDLISDEPFNFKEQMVYEAILQLCDYKIIEDFCW